MLRSTRVRDKLQGVAGSMFREVVILKWKLDDGYQK